MNWEAIAGVVAAIISLLYAALKNHQTKQAGERAQELQDVLSGTRAAVAHKEEVIRELERTVIGSLPPGKLAERLNRLFAAGRSGETSTVPTSKPEA